ncbi:hypothetical protein CNMCM6106_005613 [Aspergillus hiratsukae]|nr:hypothetical protein CNMCM6106_005613 [Aspergillus hiratsukae]
MADDNNHREVYTSADGCRFPYRNIPNVLIQDSKMGIQAIVGGCHGERLSANELNVMPNVTWDVDWRLWAAVAPTFQDAPQEVQMLHAGWEKRPIHAIMCKPRYNLYRGPVRIWREEGQSDISADIQAGSLNVTEGIAKVTGAKLLYSAMQSAVQTEVSDGSQYVFAANGTSRELFFTDTAAFTRAISDSFSCLVRQIAKNELLREEPYDVQGTEQLMEERLFVRQLSFWVMTVLLVCLSGIVGILLAFFVPVAVCPRDTGSIGGLATVLAQSPEFMKGFRGSQLKSESAMAESSLGRTRYTSSATHEGTFMLIPQDDEPRISTPQRAETMKPSQPTWWRPFTSSWFIRIPVVVIPVAVIIALEVVYHISSSARGITLVQGKSPYIHYIWVYIPALIMFAIRCLFQSVEFGARVVQPYARLRQAAAPPQTSILENQLRKIAIYGVFDTLRKKQWALAAATTSLLLAGVTPIVVSGLYTANTSWPTSPMNLTQTTRWNLGDTNSVEYSQAGRYHQPTDFATDNVPGLILHLNLSYPQWTYHDLAFPQFTLTTTTNNTDHPLPPEAEALGYIDVRLPALRSHLTCAPDPTNGGCVFEKSIMSLECDRDGACFSMGMSPSWQSGGQYFFEGSPRQENGEKANCQTHAMLYGQWNADATTAAEFHFITCNASIEEVDVDVRLQVPSFSFDPDSPPKVVPGSARRDIPTNRSSFPGLSDMREYLFNVDPTPYDSAAGDTLLQAAVSGVDGVPTAQLLSQPETLIARVNDIWGITLAQLFNTGGRESFSAPLNRSWAVLPMSTTPPVYEGVFHDGRRYLVQSEISTRILDAILGGMVLCALISLGLMQTKQILPKNPSSIAAVASFLDGARMLRSDVIPPEAQWCGDEKLRKVFEGRRFTMGWWVVDRASETSHHDNHGGEDSASDADVSERDTRGSPDDAGIRHSHHRATRFGIDINVAEERLLLNKWDFVSR